MENVQTVNALKQDLSARYDREYYIGMVKNDPRRLGQILDAYGWSTEKLYSEAETTYPKSRFPLLSSDEKAATLLWYMENRAKDEFNATVDDVRKAMPGNKQTPSKSAEMSKTDREMVAPLQREYGFSTEALFAIVVRANFSRELLSADSHGKLEAMISFLEQLKGLQNRYKMDTETMNIIIERAYFSPEFVELKLNDKVKKLALFLDSLQIAGTTNQLSMSKKLVILQALNGFFPLKKSPVKPN